MMQFSKKQLVFVAGPLHYKVNDFFKEMVINGPLGKNKHYPLRIDVQERGST